MSSSHRAASSDTDETIETEANTDGNAEDFYFTKEVFELRESDTFLGACIDSAAQKTIIGKGQAQAYCDFSNIPFELRDDTPRRNFGFGTHKHRSIGTLFVRLPINDSH